MSIRKKLQLSAAVSIFLVIVLGTFLFVLTQDVNRAGQRDKVSSDILEGVFDLTNLSYEYILNAEERTREQWYIKYISMVQFLTAGEFNKVEEYTVLRILLKEHANSQDLFSRVVYFEETGNAELRDEAASELILKMKHMAVSAVALSEISYLDLLDAQQTTVVFSLLLVIALVAVLVSVVMAVYQSIGKPVEELTEAALLISSGNLNAIVKSHQNDEIGKLAIAFNTMVKGLKEVYDSLEDKVEERTKELSLAKVHTDTIIENLTSGLIEYDNEFRVVRINKVAERLLGVSREEVLGYKLKPSDTGRDKFSSIAKVTFPGLSPGVKKLGREVTGLNADVHEMSIEYPTKRDIHIITAPVVSRTGNWLGVLKVVRDVSREKLIAQSKSDFISIAAHQLRTPLSAIKWSLNMMMGNNLGRLNATQREILNDAYESNDRMIILVNDLLNVARIDDGRFGYTFEENDITAALNQILPSLQKIAEKNDVELKVEYKKNAREPFYYDTQRIMLVLQNFIDNALKYTPSGGNVNVRMERIGDFMQIEVKDNGIGIPEDQKARLFEKFFRADNALHTQTTGSGLGMYIAKNIINRHGGSIHVESREGKGTLIVFTIPMKRELIPSE